MLISDLAIGIGAKLGNRGDIAARIPVWTRAALLELSDNYEFEELKVTGPLMQFVANKPEYPKNYFTYKNENWSRVDNWFIQTGTSNSAISTDITGTGWGLKGRTVATVMPLSKILGTPMMWTQYGQGIIVGFCPNVGYNTQWRYQRQHPFSPNDFSNDPIYIPDSWQEVIEYAAAMRGATEERAFDYVTKYHDMLYGDEKFRLTGGKEGFPGLIFGLVSQASRNLSRNERSIQPVVAHYGRR